jgi:hypothetical protein
MNAYRATERQVRVFISSTFRDMHAQRIVWPSRTAWTVRG